MLPEVLDTRMISFFRKISVPTARFGLFVVYFWFGLLKILDLSPASDLVHDLLARTLPFMTFETFFFLFGLFECLIGVLFLIRGMERLVLPLLLLHMGMTFMPLLLLPQEVWSGFMVPTLEGQYIIKNLLIIAAVVSIMAHLQPLKHHH